MKLIKNPILFPLVIFLIYVILIIFKIHSSSIGIYHQYFYGNKKDPNLILFQPRAIRSDEWLVGTPKRISQVKAGFPVVNKLIGKGEVMPVQGCLPYKHWRVFFCPNMWPFFFLPLENAFSAYWWFTNFLMILAVYFFILNLTNDITTAIFSSLIFFFTPFNQWWSYFLSYFLGYGLLFVLFFVKSIENKGIKSFIYLLLSNYFLLAFAFILYPPFQVASFYVFGLLLLAILFSKKLLFRKKTFLMFFLIFIISLLTISRFYLEFRQIIDVIRNTVYPGKRFVAYSIGSFTQLINGFYNIQLLEDFKGSGPFPNQSEASNFFPISIFALPIYLWVLFRQIKRKKIDWVFLSLNLSFVILLFWYILPAPKILAKLSFLFLVPEQRALIGIGIANYFLILYFLTKVKTKKDLFYQYLTWFSATLITVVNLYLGYFLKFNFPVHIQNDFKIILISFISLILIVLLAQQKKLLFLTTFLVFSFLSTYKVNPLYKGLSPLINTKLSKTILNIEKKDKTPHYWINYGGLYLEDYPQANGAKSISGVFYHPQKNLIKIFDKKNQYQNIWNRYAHINFGNNSEIKERFILYQGDYYRINISPCSRELKTLKVKYYLFNRPVKYRCLSLYRKINTNKKIYVYLRN